MGLGDAIGSGFQKLGNGLSENLIGDIEKATIRIIDMSSWAEMKARGQVEAEDPVNYKYPASNKMKKNETTVPIKRKNINVTDVTKTISDDEVKAKVFKVQFNPSEISIRGSAGGYATQSRFNGKDGGLVAGNIPLNITLSTRLIFDRVVPGDAFTGITSTSASAVAQRGASLINNASESRERQKKSRLILDVHSVRGEVEALIGAVRKPGAQLVNFVWGDYVNYMGLVNNISATYVMFNTNGEPIRAYVDFSMRIAEEGDDGITYLSENLWFEKYKKAFSQDSSYVKNGQKMGSLIGWG